MAKGSQLSQLKSALSQAGFVKQQQNGKKRKRTPLDEKEKERKAAKLRDIQQKMNPFDVKVTKLKHDVGGRKIAGTMGRPAQSKQAGIEQVFACLCTNHFYNNTQYCSSARKLYLKSTMSETALAA